jgi:signal transduction histidine kinase
MTEAPRATAQDVAAAGGRTIERARKRTIRLIVSLPAITTLLVLIGALVVRYYLVALGQSSGISVELQEKIDAAAATTLIVSAVLALVSGIAGFLIARQITIPLSDLEQSMESFARGEVANVPLRADLSELAYLGSSFNRMVAQLDVLFKERDRQIRQVENRARVMLDRAGTVLSCDSAVKRLLGIAARDLIGKNLNQANTLPVSVPLGAVVRVLPGMLDEAAGGLTPQRQLASQPGSDEKTLLVSLVPVEAASSDGASWLLELRDISGMQSFHAQMQRADRLAAVGTLATGIAHEIRNPLASIKGMVQLLEEEVRPLGAAAENAPDYCQRTIREIERLERLVRAIMDFAQGDDVPPEEIDLNEFVREVTGAARHAADPEEQVELRYELDPELPPVTLQAHRLRQAFLNLALNALQHAREHGGHVRVQTMFLPVNEARPAIVCFANPCDPMSPEMRDRLFEPFYTTKEEGTGLGLPIAYQSVRANGGVLDLEFDEGEAQFWVRLPLSTRGTRGSTVGIPKPQIVPESN